MAQRKLLLADDSITIQKVVNLTFADEGIEVVTVGDGDAAMEKMFEFNPDLVLADVNMPGLNGYQVCEKIKQTDEFSRTPVVLLVGSFEPFDESEAQRVGADDFLTKPFQSIRQLVSKVTELLDSGGENNTLAKDENTENVAPQDDSDSFDSNANVAFNDIETDDEMIQTNHSGGFGLDETGKFETRESYEPTEDLAEAQSFSDEEIKQFSYSSPTEEKALVEEYTADKPSEEYVSAETDFRENALEETKPEKAKSSFDLNFEDDFLLELPPGNESSEIKAEEASRQAETVAAFEKNQPAAASFVASTELSSETIDIIVRKVVEKLSDKVIREIAWEVVPQMTDLIVKKMTEEKMKES